MARREGPSGEEPRLGRAPVLSSCEFEDLGRRLIVIDGVSEFLEVDAHALLVLAPSESGGPRAREQWSDGVCATARVAQQRVFLRCVYDVWRRGDAAACAFFAAPRRIRRQTVASAPFLQQPPRDVVGNKCKRCS